MTQTNNERELFETNDGKWDGVIRAFWRRIQGYQKCEFNDIKDLPDPLPVEFRAHFATALLNAPKELRTPISQNEQQEAVYQILLSPRQGWVEVLKEDYESYDKHEDECKKRILYTSPKQIPEGWIEPQRVNVAIDEFRDLVLNQRGLLAENGMTNDMVNDVLSEFDYYFHDIKCAVPPAPTNTEVGNETHTLQNKPT